jgi:hypothetical protein
MPRYVFLLTISWHLLLLWVVTCCMDVLSFTCHHQACLSSNFIPIFMYDLHKFWRWNITHKVRLSPYSDANPKCIVEGYCSPYNRRPKWRCKKGGEERGDAKVSTHPTWHILGGEVWSDSVGGSCGWNRKHHGPNSFCVRHLNDPNGSRI